MFPRPSRICADWSAFATEQLARLSPLPCRVDAMTDREYALYCAMTPAVAALQWIATHAAPPFDAVPEETP